MSKLKSKLLKKTSKNALVSVYISYSNIVRSFVARLLSYITTHKGIILFILN